MYIWRWTSDVMIDSNDDSFDTCFTQCTCTRTMPRCALGSCSDPYCQQACVEPTGSFAITDAADAAAAAPPERRPAVCNFDPAVARGDYDPAYDLDCNQYCVGDVTIGDYSSSRTLGKDRLGRYTTWALPRFVFLKVPPGCALRIFWTEYNGASDYYTDYLHDTSAPRAKTACASHLGPRRRLPRVCFHRPHRPHRRRRRALSQ